MSAPNTSINSKSYASTTCLSSVSTITPPLFECSPPVRPYPTVHWYRFCPSPFLSFTARVRHKYPAACTVRDLSWLTARAQAIYPQSSSGFRSSHPSAGASHSAARSHLHRRFKYLPHPRVDHSHVTGSEPALQSCAGRSYILRCIQPETAPSPPLASVSTSTFFDLLR